MQQIRGVLSIQYFIINTVIWCSLLFILTFIKLAIPIKPWSKICSRIAVFIAESWIFFNNAGFAISRNIKFEIEGLEGLDRKGWYLVISNHQSWIDIPILQKVFYHKIPFLKFFLKKELIWVPFLGQAWWALDFPFMKRYRPEFLKKHPQLKGKDVEITRKACKKFKYIPVSVMNFTEGTRFTSEKHQRQKSPYKNLLRPKAGGIGFVLSAMDDQLNEVLDVTISYPQGPKDFWSFLCGKIDYVKIKVNRIPITEAIRGHYTEDREFRVKLQQWLNEIWTRKDRYMEQVQPN